MYTFVSYVVKVLGEAVIRRLIYTAALLLIGVVGVFIISMQLLGKVQVRACLQATRHSRCSPHLHALGKV